MAADTIVHVTAGRKLKCEKNIRLRINNLVKTHNMWMLKLFHRLDFTLHFLLHAQLSNLVLVEDLESDGLADGFILRHYSQKGNIRSKKCKDLRLTLP